MYTTRTDNNRDHENYEQITNKNKVYRIKHLYFLNVSSVRSVIKYGNIIFQQSIIN